MVVENQSIHNFSQSQGVFVKKPNVFYVGIQGFFITLAVIIDTAAPVNM